MTTEAKTTSSDLSSLLDAMEAFVRARGGNLESVLGMIGLGPATAFGRILRSEKSATCGQIFRKVVEETAEIVRTYPISAEIDELPLENTLGKLLRELLQSHQLKDNQSKTRQMNTEILHKLSESDITVPALASGLAELKASVEALEAALQQARIASL